MTKPLLLMSANQLFRHSNSKVETKTEAKDEFEPQLKLEHDIEMQDHALNTNHQAEMALLNGEEVPLLADCVWFVCTLSKHLGVQSVSHVPHIALHMLNRYAMKVGIKKGLVEEDRFLLAAACFFIATKVTSQHCKSESILEFYYEVRPLNKNCDL